MSCSFEANSFKNECLKVCVKKYKYKNMFQHEIADTFWINKSLKFNIRRNDRNRTHVILCCLQHCQNIVLFESLKVSLKLNIRKYS